MKQELALAIRLQSLDRKISHLEQELAAMPKQIAEIERKLEAQKRKLEIDRAALAANTRERKKHEGDIQVHEQKISKLRDQTLQAKTNEQYRAFQNEIGWCETEIRKAEDRILELMEEAESQEKTVTSSESELKQQSASVEQEKTRAKAVMTSEQKVLTESKTERAQIQSQMDPKLYADYERIRRKTKGSVVAEAVDGRCDSCMIAIRPQFLQELKLGEKVMYCENCGRILLYNPPVAFEGNIGPAATTA